MYCIHTICSILSGFSGWKLFQTDMPNCRFPKRITVLTLACFLSWEINWKKINFTFLNFENCLLLFLKFWKQSLFFLADTWMATINKPPWRDFADCKVKEVFNQDCYGQGQQFTLLRLTPRYICTVSDSQIASPWQMTVQDTGPLLHLY